MQVHCDEGVAFHKLGKAGRKLFGPQSGDAYHHRTVDWIKYKIGRSDYGAEATQLRPLRSASGSPPGYGSVAIVCRQPAMKIPVALPGADGAARRSPCTGYSIGIGDMIRFLRLVFAACLLATPAQADPQWTRLPTVPYKAGRHRVRRCAARLVRQRHRTGFSHR